MSVVVLISLIGSIVSILAGIVWMLNKPIARSMSNKIVDVLFNVIDKFLP